MADEGLMEAAAAVATQKASQVAGGFVGEKAGEMAAEAVQKYGPRMREQMRRGLRVAKENPGRTGSAVLLLIAMIAGAAYWASTRD